MNGVSFLVRVLEGGRVGFKVEVTDSEKAIATAKWFREFLADVDRGLKRVTLRILNRRDGVEMRVTPIPFVDPIQRGDLVLHGLELQHAGVPSLQEADGFGYAVLRVAMSCIWPGDMNLAPEPPTTKELLKAIEGGRIQAVASVRDGKVAIHFRDRDSDEHAKIYGAPRAASPVTEKSIRDRLVDIIVEEYGADALSRAQSNLSSFRTRLLFRIKSFVLPASASEEHAVRKAEWFVNQVVPACERKKMDRESIGQLVDEIAAREVL